MIKINFPKDKIKIREQEGLNEIFDPVRKKWVLLTPEEWVRQNFIQFLFREKYPASLIAIEKEIKLGELRKRCDIVVYSRDMQPRMIIECKEMNVALSEKTIGQILRYHLVLPCKFLVITNGSYSYGFEKIEGAFKVMNSFPPYFS